MRTVVGREAEVEILMDALESNRPELIVVHGRRRVGKTFLIHSSYLDHLIFEFSGIKDAPLRKQLKNFYNQLSRPKDPVPEDWIDAFELLIKQIKRSRLRKKKVIFIDEFPWLDTHKSNFLAAFDHFWNSFASRRDDLIVVVCGSAASYMIKKIIKNKGGLHNRLTQEIQLSAFNLYEAEQLLKRNRIKLSRYDILLLYMTMGGIPHYLERIKPNESAAQAIDRLCFRKNGFLRNEFAAVFASLFDHHENHENIIRALAKVRKGLTRNELLTKTKIASGGTLTKTLTELEQSGFIDKYMPYKGSKDALYRLIDQYSMFYTKYIEKTKPSRANQWNLISKQQSFKSWCGFTFETICIQHVEQIKEALKISGIHSTHGSWVTKKAPKGVQIDLLIDRDDGVINLCEMKFHNAPYEIKKKYAEELTLKANTFAERTATRKSIFLTMITTYGLHTNTYSQAIIQNELSLDDLFLPL